MSSIPHSKDKTLLPQATFNAPYITRPAGFCILMFKLCSTFLTPPYKSQLAVIPFIAIQGAYSSMILSSTDNYADEIARCTMQDLGSYSTVAVGCDAVTGTAFPFKHQQPVTQ
jgi:hypothetical protein